MTLYRLYEIYKYGKEIEHLIYFVTTNSFDNTFISYKSFDQREWSYCQEKNGIKRGW